MNDQRLACISEVEEAQILMQALYDTNLPKFLKDDVILFQNLMNDLFPNLPSLNKNIEAIEKSIIAATSELNLQQWPSQKAKILQLYDQMLVRHGIMLVGPTGGGKTVARNILQRALQLLPTYLPKRQEEEGEKPGLDKQKSFNGIVSALSWLFISLLLLEKVFWVQQPGRCQLWNFWNEAEWKGPFFAQKITRNGICMMRRWLRIMWFLYVYTNVIFKSKRNKNNILVAPCFLSIIS